MKDLLRTIIPFREVSDHDKKTSYHVRPADHEVRKWHVVHGLIRSDNNLSVVVAVEHYRRVDPTLTCEMRKVR